MKLSMKDLPGILMVSGLALAVIEELTYKSGAGGMLFGSSGYLKGLNDMLPVWTIPGTKTVSVRYPNGYPINLSGWLLLIGAGLAVYRRAQ